MHPPPLPLLHLSRPDWSMRRAEEAGHRGANWIHAERAQRSGASVCAQRASARQLTLREERHEIVVLDVSQIDVVKPSAEEIERVTLAMRGRRQSGRGDDRESGSV